jgi:tetratricopeptide (TPR) repeat protein
MQEVALGNAAYAQFDNQTALQHFLNALKADPNNYEALWKGARAYADVGKTLEKSDKDKAKKLYLLGDTLARKSVMLYPDSADAHFALALCVGRVALFEGGKTKIRLSKEVKKEADKAIELDPNHDGAYHIIGRWHYNISTLSWVLKAAAKVIYGGVPPGASLEQAAEMYEKAIAIQGDKPVHRLEAGRTLIELERYSEARVQLQTCIDLPQAQWDDPVHKEEAAKMLQEIKNKKDKASSK